MKSFYKLFKKYWGVFILLLLNISPIIAQTGFVLHWDSEVGWLYTLSGTQLETRTIKESEGEVNFDLSRLASGNYILVFYHYNVRLGQQIIIKK